MTLNQYLWFSVSTQCVNKKLITDHNNSLCFPVVAKNNYAALKCVNVLLGGF